MKRIVTCSAVCALLLGASQALPCGGGFGQSVNIEPVQKIIVSHHDGIQTYVFNPYFCQNAESFGLILPIPTPLTRNPELLDKRVYDDLATVAAPTIETQTVCGQGGSRGVGGSAGSGGSKSNSTIVIDKGQVGIFDWALLRATSTDSFTTWLSANGFPYQSSATAIFSQYVSDAWYFIAFKVSVGSNSTGVGGSGTSASATSISSGQTLCGNFGPISLAFTQSTPVIPTRIASVSSSRLQWSIYALASERLRIRNQATSLLFAGPITTDAMSQHQSLAAVARAGDRLTELEVTLYPAITMDLFLETDPDQADYRRVETRNVYVTCATGGSAGTGGAPQTGGTSPRATTDAGSAAVTGGTGSQIGASSMGGTPFIVTAVGGIPATGGQLATGGVPIVSGTSTETAPKGDPPRDEGGCAVTGASTERNPFSLILVALAGVLLRRRRTASR